MAKNDLRLVKFTAESFGNIDKANPVVIVFPEGFGGYINFSGNQEVGKTSLMAAVACSLGAELPANALNNIDNDIKEEIIFTKGGKEYRGKLTKSRFEVSTLIEERWASVNQPKAMIAELAGPIAQSPLFLRDYEGKKQIEWLRSFFRLTPEQIQFEKDLDKKIKDAYDSRRNVNREMKKVDQALSANDYHVKRGEWEKKIKDHKPGDAKKKIDETTKKHTQYQNSITEAKRLRVEKIPEIDKKIQKSSEDLAEVEKQITELQAKLIRINNEQGALLDERNETVLRAEKFDKYLEDEQGVIKEYADISKVVREQSEMAVHKEKFSQMVTEEQKSNHFHEEYTRLEAILDEHKELKKKFVAEFTPDIKGLEVLIGDEEDPREGIFYEKRPLSEISESEMWEVLTLFLQKLKVKIMFIENISSLGTGAIKLFNKFIGAGGYIFASEMDRTSNELTVSFADKIE